jgi:hypothetical protein
MKEAGTTNWLNPNTGAINTSLFTALPGGYRGSSDGEYGGIGESGFWWSSTDWGLDDFALMRYLLCNSDIAFRTPRYPMVFGMSVRCLKD